MTAALLHTNRSPWLWVPTLYFFEGIPYFLVNSISVLLFAKMGVPNDDLSVFTTLLYFPWFLKFLWSPFVEVFKTKRWWIIATQLVLAVLCVLLVITLPHPDATLIQTKGTSIEMFKFTLILFILSAFASATHDIAADGFYLLAHNQTSQAAFVGIRSTFYRIASVFSQGILVYIAGTIENQTENIPLSWQVTIAITAILLFFFGIYHYFVLPKCEDTPTTSDIDNSVIWKELCNSFISFFTKPGIVLAICFMLLYRLSEGFLVKLCPAFLVDARQTSIVNGQIFGGGLGMSTSVYGLLYGTIGVICLLAGGIMGGLVIAHKGLKRSIWGMALALTLPSFVYVYLSYFQPTSLWVIGSAIGFEQLGYGYGFTAYMMYMIHVSDGKYKTSHYAICTAFMALSMMIPGFIAGKIELTWGYNTFFWIANACSITTFIVTYYVYKQLK